MSKHPLSKHPLSKQWQQGAPRCGLLAMSLVMPAAAALALLMPACSRTPASDSARGKTETQQSPAEDGVVARVGSRRVPVSELLRFARRRKLPPKRALPLLVREELLLQRARALHLEHRQGWIWRHQALLVRALLRRSVEAPLPYPKNAGDGVPADGAKRAEGDRAAIAVNQERTRALVRLTQEAARRFAVVRQRANWHLLGAL